METRGRKRKFNPNIPAHIDQSKIPNGCYWDNSGSGHWYTAYKDEQGKNRRKRIAGKTALLSDLHRLVEEFNGIIQNTFKYVSSEYLESDNFHILSDSTKDSYMYCNNILNTYMTKLNKPISEIPLSSWSPPLVQNLIDKLSKNRGKTTAKHVHGYLRLVFRWGKNRGYCSNNPALGTELPKERKLQRLPTNKAYKSLLDYAKKNGTFGQKCKGSCPHYIWAIMEIEYLCRLRGIECRTLTDAHITKQGLLAERRKGSKTNITAWNDRLKNAVDYLIQCRREIWTKCAKPIPVEANRRPVIVNTLGDPLTKSAYQSSWQRFIKNAIQLKIIDESERFGLHDLKRKGITDTKGSQAEKMEASGHKDPRMMDVYDKSISTVNPANS